MLGTLLFNTAIGIGMPYETIFATQKIGASIGAVGFVWTLSAFAGLPMQLVGGMLCDRLGRRPVLIVSAATIIVFYAVMAVAHSLVQIGVVAVVEASFGWPLFLIGCNAMIADLLPYGRRPVAYSVWRAVMNAGVVIGPLIAFVLLGAGLSYRGLFTCASVGCGAFLLVAVLWVRETQPHRPRDATVLAVDDEPTSSWRDVGVAFRDRNFVSFAMVAVLPLFCIGQYLWVFPVYLTTTLHLAPVTWGRLLTASCAFIAVLSTPVVRLTRRADKMILLSVACLLVGVGLGGTAFVRGGWAVAVLIMIFSLGEVLFWPISSAAVAEMAPPAQRGRFMGAWTLVDCAGRGVGPFVGGWLMDTAGARQAFAVLFVVGLAGAGLFPLLRRREQPRPEISS